MKRSSSQAVSKKGEWACPDKAFVKEYPTLAQGLCDCWWEDGKPRVPWTITIRFEGGACHACLNDKEAKMGLYTTAEDLPSVLAAVEECLSQGTASWRRWRS